MEGFLQVESGMLKHPSSGTLVGQFGLQLFNNGFKGNVFTLARFTEGAAALATEVDAEVLEDTGASGAFSNQLAHGAFLKWGSS